MNLASRSTALTLTACALALTLGATAGSRRTPSASTLGTANGSGAEPQPTPAATAGPGPGGAAAPAPVDEAFAKAMTTETGAQRWLRMLASLETATAEDLPGLIQLAGDDASMVRMLAARWAELDPAHLFRWIYSESFVTGGSPAAQRNRSILTDALFEEWMKSDPAAALNTLNTAKEFPGREQLRMTAASRAMMNGRIEEGLKAMRDWNIRNFLPNLEGIDKWAAADPRHAAELASQLDGIIGTEVLKRVGQAWAQTDPAGGLEYAATLPAGARAVFATELVRGWAERDLTAAVRFAEGQEDLAFRSALGQGLAAVWGRSDPAGALAWSQQNLYGAARTEAIAGLIQATAEKDLRSAAELVAGMAPGAAQNRASASIFETWFKKGKEERDAAFDWLAALPDPEARRAALERIQWDWSWREPDAVRAFLTGPHGDLATDGMVQQVARKETAKDPEAALRWAKALPGDRSVQAREAVLQQWLMIRPEGAAAYALTIPAGDERSRAITTVASTLGYQSPQQAANWFRKLPGADQTAARRIFDGMPEEQRKQFTQALKR